MNSTRREQAAKVETPNDQLRESCKINSHCIAGACDKGNNFEVRHIKERPDAILPRIW